MRIDNLTIKTMRTHVHTELACSRINVVLGNNGTGKTTIAWAIEFLLTGVLPPGPNRPGTPTLGYPTQKLIRDGAPSFVVTAVVGSAEITRMQNKKKSLLVRHNGFTYQDRGAEGWIEENIGNKDVLSAVLNASTFLDMTPVEQKALLAKALTGESVPIVPSILKLGANHQLPEKVNSAEEVDRIYKRLFDQRTDVNRQNKALGDLYPPEIPIGMPTAKEVADQLADLQLKKEGSIARRQTKLAPWTRATEAADKERARREEITREIASLSGRKVVPATIPALEAEAAKLADAENLDAEIRNLAAVVSAEFSREVTITAELKRAEGDISPDDYLDMMASRAANLPKAAELDAAVQNAFQNVRVARENLEAASVKSERCPTCHRKWDDLEQQKTRWKDAKKVLSDAEKELKQQQEALDALGDPATAKATIDAHHAAVAKRTQLSAELEAITANKRKLANLKDERSNLGNPAGSKATLEAHKAAIKREAELRDELARMTGPTAEKPDVSAEDAEIADLDGRLARGREIQREVQELAGKLEQYESIRLASLRLTEESVVLDELVQYFSDKGPLKAQLIGGKLPAFKENLNRSLARFGFSCTFELEPYELSISNMRHASRRHLEVDQLSESEQYRFSIAFSVALAEATGVGIAVIDRGDLLLGDTRSDLADLLECSKLDQAWVMAASDSPAPTSAASGMQYVCLSNTNGETSCKVVRGEFARLNFPQPGA